MSKYNYYKLNKAIDTISNLGSTIESITTTSDILATALTSMSSYETVLKTNTTAFSCLQKLINSSIIDTVALKSAYSIVRELGKTYPPTSSVLTPEYFDSFANALIKKVNANKIIEDTIQTVETLSQSSDDSADTLVLSEDLAEFIIEIDESIELPAFNEKNEVCVKKEFNLELFIAVISLIATLLQFAYGIYQSNADKITQEKYHAETMAEEQKQTAELKKQTIEEQKQTALLQQLVDSLEESSSKPQEAPANIHSASQSLVEGSGATPETENNNPE